jgi:hypothetical protein
MKAQFKYTPEELTRIISGLVQDIQSYHASFSKDAQRYFKSRLDWGIREMRNARQYVSLAAQTKATEMELGDISYCGWFDQKSKMKDPKRKIFHYEHFLPIGEQIKRLLALDAPANESVQAIIMEGAVCWILKDEDLKLRKAGYNSKRPDPKKAYAEVGIIII